MPKLNVRLASTRQTLGSGGGSGLRPSKISGGYAAGLRTPRVNVNAGQVQYTPLPLPQTVVDTTISEAGSFAAVATEAAFNFQQRENKLRRDYAVSRYSAELRRAFNGYENEDGEWVKGYGQYEKTEAVEGFNVFQDQAKAKMQEYLNNLDPAVRQQAALQMMSDYDMAMSKAALHKAKELRKAEDEALYVKQQETVAKIAANPELITTPDPVFGVTLKQQFRANFRSKVAADKAWADTVELAVERVYQDKGIEAAKDFYRNVAQFELQSYMKHDNRVVRSLHQWEMDDIRWQNAEEDRKQRLLAKQKKELFDKTEQQVTADALEGKLYSKAELAQKVKAGIMDPSFARAYVDKYYDEGTKVSDPEVFRMYESQIANGTIRPRSYLNDTRLTGSDRIYLRNLETQSGKSKTSQWYKIGVKEINGWYKKSMINGFSLFANQEDSQLVNQAVSELRARLDRGEDYFSIIQDLYNRYEPATISWKRLPSFRTGAKPETPTGLSIQRAIIKKKLELGEYSAEEAGAEMSLLLKYVNSIKAKLATPTPTPVKKLKGKLWE